MARSTTFLNFTAFLILYIIGFIVINVRNTEIIGYYFIFILNVLFTLYGVSHFFTTAGVNVIPAAIAFTVIASAILNMVSFLFIVMMASSMRSKYADHYGENMKLPLEYQDKLDLFKKLAVTAFSFCALLTIIFIGAYEQINIDFSNVKSIGNAMYYSGQLSVLPICVVPLVISCIEVVIANDFLKLTRKQLI